MSNKERDVTVIKKDGTTESVSMSEEIKQESRAQKKARLAALVERGQVYDMLDVDVGPDLHAEFVHKDDVTRNQAMGFRLATREDVRNKQNPSVHSEGDSKVIVGDVVLMVTDRETHEILREIEHDKLRAANDPKPKQREENEYSRGAAFKDPGYIAPLAESKTQEAKKAEIDRAIQAANVSTHSPVLPASAIK